MSSIRPRAVAFGVGAYIIGAVLLAVFIRYGLQLSLHARGLTDAQMAARIAGLTATARFLTFEALAGLALTAFGGFCASRMAGQAETVNACCVGLVCVLIEAAVKTDSPAWAMAVTFILTVPAAYAGGMAAVWTKKTATVDATSADQSDAADPESAE